MLPLIMMSKPEATINTQALTHNLKRVKQTASHGKVISVIKANAYGHGVVPVAKALNESDYFAVARLDEALYLREQGIKKTILLLEGVYSIEDYKYCAQLQLIPVIHCLQQFHDLQSYCLEQSSSEKSRSDNKFDSILEFWLKCDTGMHRIGLSADEFASILEQLNNIKNQCLFSGLMSHFSCADDIDNPINNTQLLQFKKYYQLLAKDNPVKWSIKQSMANSAAILTIPDAHFDWLRPGIMLYGVSPFESSKPIRTGLDEQLLPVMTLSAPLITIKKLKKGDCIGYGASWCCPHDMTIGVIGIGYGDGYPRHAGSGTPVLIHNTEVPLVGRVSMDMITVDLTLLEEKSIPLTLGDKAILWGEGLPVEKVSQNSGTIAYELLCQITQRVTFNYV